MKTPRVVPKQNIIGQISDHRETILRHGSRFTGMSVHRHFQTKDLKGHRRFEQEKKILLTVPTRSEGCLGLK